MATKRTSSRKSSATAPARRKPGKARAGIPAGGSLRPRAGLTAQEYFNSAGDGNDVRSDLRLPQPRDYKKDLTPTVRKDLVSKMRHGMRNSGEFRQIVGDFVNYGVGSGITPQSHAEDPDVAKEHTAYFMEWAKRCDITNRFSFWDVQRLSERGRSTDGDYFEAVVRDERGDIKVQLIESHRVATPYDAKDPRSVDGVNFDAFGRVVSYSVLLDDGTYFPVPASQMLHIFDPESCSGTRGLPMLQHAWNGTQDLMEILALEAQAVKVHADQVAVLKKAGGEFGAEQSDELRTGPQRDSGFPSGKGGKLISLEPGEDLDLKASQRPNSNFVSYVEFLKRDIAQGTIPYEFVDDASKLGGVSMRLVGSKAARAFSRVSDIHIERECNPWWFIVIGDAIERGLVRRDPKWTSVSWTAPKQLTMDAGREAGNDREDIAAGLLTFTEHFRRQGSNLDEEAEQLARDYARFYALEKQYGLPEGLLTAGLRKGVAFMQEPLDVNTARVEAGAESTEQAPEPNP
jgi:lambda family phage portal protein